MLDSTPFVLVHSVGFVLLVVTTWISVVNCEKKKTKKKPRADPTAPNPNAPKASELKPQVIPKNEKEELIAKGQLKRGKHDYPTMDDVVSDWETEEEGVPEGEKKEKKKGAKKPKSAIVAASKDKSKVVEAKPDGAEGGAEKSKVVDPPAK